MKGLFVKDLKLMMLQKNFLLLILAIVIGMMIFTDDVVFPLGFLSFIVSLFTVSTISYDDFDNRNAFLFTLPITRNNYVIEKYSLGLLFGCIAWILASGIHDYYEPEELIGKTAIAIVNLPPRKMMGIDSEGMLISAVHEEDGHEGLNLLMVNDHIPAGAKLY